MVVKVWCLLLLGCNSNSLGKLIVDSVLSWLIDTLNWLSYDLDPTNQERAYTVKPGALGLEVPVTHISKKTYAVKGNATYQPDF